ncbi:2-dehydro-3-deoxy-6-phosphogalactonate aldolase [Paraglaciecola sp.]|uniref:2-dehydro-3-deoxy-6-phosphogalactonate aldolase n=1 Tax=Paraglaciecola sp. TaxID=1920173 RepID=UPI003EF4ADEF
MNQKFDLAGRLPLIAIIRGVTPDEVLNVASILIEEGFSLIEVPLNSPDALTSIKKLVDTYGQDNLIGAGTVTTVEQAEQVITTGANLVVTPNCNTEVIKMAVAAGCATFPGIVTPTEAFAALAAGATGIKLFPVSMLGLDGYKALNSVLPKGTLCYPVGGIEPTIESMRDYVKIGAAGFGLGSALYKPGLSDEQIRKNAKDYVSSYHACLDENAK